MSYGGFLNDESGNPFYIDGTLPLRLIDVRTFTSNPGAGFFDLYPDDGQIRFTFVSSTAEGYYFITQDLTNHGTNWILTSSVPNGTVITAYIFGYSVETFLPEYGLAVWNDQGQLVITNETKVLSNIQTLGDRNSDTNSGMNLNVTLSGHWAVAPTLTGAIVGVVFQGSQPRPFSSFFYTCASFDGTNTVVRSHGSGGDTSGGASNIQITNTREQLVVVDVSRF